MDAFPGLKGNHWEAPLRREMILAVTCFELVTQTVWDLGEIKLTFSYEVY